MPFLFGFTAAVGLGPFFVAARDGRRLRLLQLRGSAVVPGTTRAEAEAARAPAGWPDSKPAAEARLHWLHWLPWLHRPGCIGQGSLRASTWTR
jgi:hypothetical protein